jgi:hypothetical protein
MSKYPLIVASITALLTLAGSAPAQAQSTTGQPIPDAPQPQKKPAPKPQPPSDPSSDTSAAPAPPATQPKNENPFPEAVSSAAAKAASQGAADDSTPAATKPGVSDSNPFPEAVSRDAAKAAGNDPSPTPAPKLDLPPGVSSSQSQSPDGTAESEPKVTDPVRAKKDTEVGGFYLKTGDYKGALLRYQDATAADPTNVAAIFGLAESQRSLGKNAEAAHSYQLYLDIVPNGPKAKEAIKALKTLQAGK